MGEARRKRQAQAAETEAPATDRPEVAEAARRMVAHLADERPRIGPLLRLCLSEPAAERVLGRLALCRPKVVVDPNRNVTVFPGSLSPRAGRLARRFYELGVADAEAVAEAVLAELCRSELRSSALALFASVEALPSGGAGALLADAYDRRCNRQLFGHLLVFLWLSDSYLVAEAAGFDPGRLRDWFLYADLAGNPLPMVGRVCDFSPLPERLTLWRGGAGGPSALAKGASWTPLRGIAAVFAKGRGNGRGLIIRREVPREKVVARFGHIAPEYIVPEPGEWLVDTSDQQVIEALVREVSPAWNASVEREVGRYVVVTLDPELHFAAEGRPVPGVAPPAGGGWPARWGEIEREAMRRATPASRASALHGPRHWRAVARVGIELARRTPGADLELVVLFALLHDSQRWCDGADPQHGYRAHLFALDLACLGLLDLEHCRLSRLVGACLMHVGGYVHQDPTIGTCWDADRLNLWRVGVEPAPALLSTEAARDPAVLAWSRTVHAAPPSWTEIEALARGVPAPVDRAA